jgi:hypothetical protein
MISEWKHGELKDGILREYCVTCHRDTLLTFIGINPTNPEELQFKCQVCEEKYQYPSCFFRKKGLRQLGLEDLASCDED